MTRDELKNRFQGISSTIPTPFDDGLKIDFGRMADLTRWWVEQGLGSNVAPLKVAAAMGEGPDLGDDEWPHLLRTVVNAAGNGATVLCGLKPKNTLHTIEDARKAQDLGAAGLQIDLPMFHHPNQDDYVRFFTDISDAIDIGIMIYNTHWFGCESITADTMLRLVDAERVVAVKWDVPEHMDYDDMRRFVHIFNVIDNARTEIRCHKNGGRGYISDTVAAYPQHDLRLWQLMEEQRYQEAEEEFRRVKSALNPFIASCWQRSGGYRFAKGLMSVVGQPVGSPRPPTLPLDATELNELRAILEELEWPVARLS